MSKKGKVLITFDDGIHNQYHASQKLDEHNIKAVFGIVTDKIGKPGFCSLDELLSMKAQGHIVINHSASHGIFERDTSRPYLKGMSKEEIVQDFEKGKQVLNDYGFDGDYYMAPFGTMNLDDEIFKEISEKCKWIRLTIGCNIEGEWCLGGNKRIYPNDYKDNVIGITVAADCRFPDEVQQRIDEACEVGGICIICYHDVCSIVGEDQKITWERFCRDVGYMAGKIKNDELEVILPKDIIKE